MRKKLNPSLDAISGKAKGKGKGKKGKSKDDLAKGKGKGRGRDQQQQRPVCIEKRACHGCGVVGHILRDCTAVVAKRGVSGVDGAEVAPSAPARGTLASFVVKRHPMGCSGDCEWRLMNARGSATVDREVELRDCVLEEYYLV